MSPADLLSGTPLASIPDATVAALIAGTLLPMLGVWVVYQRIVFLGVTLAQVAAAGVALGLLLDLPPLPMGFLLCAIMVAVVARGFRGGIGSGGDSALGAAFCVASALALLFISRSPAEVDEIEHVLHGNLIFALPQDVLRVSIALVAGLAVIGLFFKQILFSAFDGETAAALGLRPRLWLLVLFAVLAVVLTLSMTTTGSLLTSALLILPPLAALQFRRGMKATFALTALLGFLGTLAGLLLAVTADLHLESSIVVTTFLLLPLVACWRLSPFLALAAVAALAWLAPHLAPAAGPAPAEQQAAARDTTSDLPPDIAALLAEGDATAATAAAAQPRAPGSPAPPVTPSASPGASGAAAAPAHHAELLELSLFAQPAAEPATVEVSWTLDLKRGTPPVALPRTLWLVTSGCGVTDERAIVRDTAQLPPGDQLLTGSIMLKGTTSVGPIAGQLWTGPRRDERSVPVPGAIVHPSTAPAAHGHP